MSKAIILTFLLVGFTQSSFAAQETSVCSDKEKIGVVSITGASNLSDVTQQLNAKADNFGASSFRIVSAGGKNRMYGVAELYK
jgi:multiple stress resistance protein BhsA